MITQKQLNKLLHPPTYDLYILQGLNLKSLGELVGDVLRSVGVDRIMINHTTAFSLKVLYLFGEVLHVETYRYFMMYKAKTDLFYGLWFNYVMEPDTPLKDLDSLITTPQQFIKTIIPYFISKIEKVLPNN